MTSVSWAESYLGQLRALAGDRTLLFVGARAVLHDEAGRLLLIRRSDNGHWALPAGAMELGESLADCAVREVAEETGLVASRVTPFALYSGPDYTYTNMYGDRYQQLMMSFRVDEWHGELVRQTDETIDAAFFPVTELPSLPGGVVDQALADLEAFQRDGRLVLK